MISTEMLMERREETDAKKNMQSGRKSNCGKRWRMRKSDRGQVDGSDC